LGRFLVKYHPAANNHVVSILESEGVEAVVPDMMDFFLYSVHDGVFRHPVLAGSRAFMLGSSKIAIRYLEHFRRDMKKALDSSQRFEAPKTTLRAGREGKEHSLFGPSYRRGWFLTAEMIELIEMGVPNIVCVQPFGCLPNHVTGKGMLRALKKNYPESNIVAIDYDPGASEVNQVNRIKLMLSVAFKNLGLSESMPAAGSRLARSASSQTRSR